MVLTNSWRFLLLALCGAALPAPATAQMLCSTYLAGFAARDEFVLDQAARLAEGLIASSWSSPAMRGEEGSGAPARGRRELVLRQLQRNCRVLPRAHIEDIVGVLNRNAGPPQDLPRSRTP